jgi:hypothetical protein
MPTNEERMQILEMLEAGQISAQEAANLLTALDTTTDGARGEGDRTQWFRVRVTDTHSGRTKVNVNIPIELVDLGLRLGAHFSPEIRGMELAQVVEDIRNGIRGRLMEVEDIEGKERVEIFVE